MLEQIHNRKSTRWGPVVGTPLGWHVPESLKTIPFMDIPFVWTQPTLTPAVERKAPSAKPGDAPPPRFAGRSHVDRLKKLAPNRAPISGAPSLPSAGIASSCALRLAIPGYGSFPESHGPSPKVSMQSQCRANETKHLGSLLGSLGTNRI